MAKTSSMPDLVVTEWSEEDFIRGRDKWDSLLRESSANKLFLSWEWSKTWWEIYRKTERLRLKLLVAKDESDQLVGIAPLYIHAYRLGRLLPLRRMEFLGNRWRGRDSVRAEYLDLIVKNGFEDIAVEKFLNKIEEDKDWDELVLCNLASESLAYRSVAHRFNSPKYFLRDIEKGETRGIRLSEFGGFQEFLAKLRPKTRRKTYNQRKRLESHGKVALIEAEQENIDDFINTINQLHCKRWGRNVFKGRRLEFHKTFAQLIGRRGYVDFSLLCVDGRSISCLYDFTVDDTKFGYQMGFDDKFDKKISPAFLHIGYAIERCFEKNLAQYDFLRGAGRNSPYYKARLTQPFTEMVTTQVVRPGWLKRLHQLYANWRNIRSG